MRRDHKFDPDRILKFFEKIMNSKVVDVIHIIVMILAVLYFGGHILWWWIEKNGGF